MRIVLGILILMALFWAGSKFFNYSKQTIDRAEGIKDPAAAQQFNPASLPGLPGELEASLQTVTQQGAPKLRQWLDFHRAQIKDPRLGWIELDYLTMLSLENPTAAREIFQNVKRRTPTNSPIYFRIKQMQKTYE